MMEFIMTGKNFPRLQLDKEYFEAGVVLSASFHNYYGVYMTSDILGGQS